MRPTPCRSTNTRRLTKAIPAPSLSRIIKTLDANGFIVLRKDPLDGRRAVIGLTAKAEDFINEIAPESAAIYADLEKRAGKKQIAELLKTIDALIAAIDN